MSDELDLGIRVPPTPVQRGVTAGHEVDPEGRQLPRVGYTWDRARGAYQPCKICFDRAEKVNGLPTVNIPRATMVRRDSLAILYLCAKHGHSMRTGDDVSRPRR